MWFASQSQPGPPCQPRGSPPLRRQLLQKQMARWSPLPCPWQPCCSASWPCASPALSSGHGPKRSPKKEGLPAMVSRPKRWTTAATATQRKRKAAMAAAKPLGQSGNCCSKKSPKEPP